MHWSFHSQREIVPSFVPMFRDFPPRSFEHWRQVRGKISVAQQPNGMDVGERLPAK
jgi:hypothetical protein